MRKIRKNFAGYPGDGYRLAICDLCGAKRHIQDMKLIQAEFNRSDGAFICKEHKRPTHPQDIPYVVEPDIIQEPEYIRSRNFPVRMQPVNNSNILPTAPRELRVHLDSFGDAIQLEWLGPSNTGSSPIIGYLIQIQYPLGSAFATLTANTLSSAPAYVDTVTPINDICIYRVAAISELGTSPFSNSAYFPSPNSQDLAYVLGDDLYAIAGDSSSQIFVAGG